MLTPKILLFRLALCTNLNSSPFMNITFCNSYKRLQFGSKNLPSAEADGKFLLTNCSDTELITC